MDETQSWTLIDQDDEVALFIENETNGSWIIGNLMPFPSFEQRRGYFEQNLTARVDNLDPLHLKDLIQQNKRELSQRGTKLIPTDGTKNLSGFALFIVGNNVWIRQ